MKKETIEEIARLAILDDNRYLQREKKLANIINICKMFVEGWRLIPSHKPLPANKEPYSIKELNDRWRLQYTRGIGTNKNAYVIDFLK